MELSLALHVTFGNKISNMKARVVTPCGCKNNNNNNIDGEDKSAQQHDQRHSLICTPPREEVHFQGFQISLKRKKFIWNKINWEFKPNFGERDYRVRLLL